MYRTNNHPGRSRRPIAALAVGVAALFAALPADAQVTLINVFEVPESALPATIDGWEAARDFLAAEPGYVSTTLHRAIDGEARFQLINVAVWESEAAFAAAARRMAAEGIFPRIEGVVVNPALYTVIRSDR